MVEVRVTSRNLEMDEATKRGIIYQIAAEAGSETRRIVPADPDAIHGEYSELVFKGLEAIVAMPAGSDYHGVSPKLAEDVLLEAYFH